MLLERAIEPSSTHRGMMLEIEAGPSGQVGLLTRKNLKAPYAWKLWASADTEKHPKKVKVRIPNRLSQRATTPFCVCCLSP